MTLRECKDFLHKDPAQNYGISTLKKWAKIRYESEGKITKSGYRNGVKKIYAGKQFIYVVQESFALWIVKNVRNYE